MLAVITAAKVLLVSHEWITHCLSFQLFHLLSRYRFLAQSFVYSCLGCSFSLLEKLRLLSSAHSGNWTILIIWVSKHLPGRNVYSPPATPICQRHQILRQVMCILYSCLTDMCDVRWIGRKKNDGSCVRSGGGGSACSPSPPRCRFRQLWTQKWRKSSCSSDHKAPSWACNCSCVERELFPPMPALGSSRWREESRQDKDGQEGMCGRTKWQDGWQDVGRFWHSHLWEWAAGWEVSLIHSSSESQRLGTETGSWLKSGCRVYGWWMSHVGW